MNVRYLKEMDEIFCAKHDEDGVLNIVKLIGN